MKYGFNVQYNGDAIAQTRPTATVWAYAAAAVASGAVVEIDTATDPPGGGTNAGVMAIKTMASQKGIGAAVRAIAAGTWGEICVLGIQEGVAVTGVVALNDHLNCSTTDGTLVAAAQVATWDPNLYAGPMARALSANSGGGGGGGTCTVEWFDVYGYGR